MNWVPLISPFDDMVIEMRQELGAESYIHLAQLMKLWMENGELHVDAKFLKRNCGINAQRAEKVGEKLVETLEKVVRKLEKTCKIVGKKLQESDGKVASFDASNPHGSTRVKKESLSVSPSVCKITDANASVPKKTVAKADRKKYEPSPDARVAVTSLTDALKRKGARTGQFTQQWFFAGCRVADKLLNAFTVDEIKQAVDYLVDHPTQGQWIRTMTDVNKNITLWQRRNEAKPNQLKSAILPVATHYEKTGVMYLE